MYDRNEKSNIYKYVVVGNIVYIKWFVWLWVISHKLSTQKKTDSKHTKNNLFKLIYNFYLFSNSSFTCHCCLINTLSIRIIYQKQSNVSLVTFTFITKIIEWNLHFCYDLEIWVVRNCINRARCNIILYGILR